MNAANTYHVDIRGFKKVKLRWQDGFPMGDNVIKLLFKIKTIYTNHRKY